MLHLAGLCGIAYVAIDGVGNFALNFKRRRDERLEWEASHPGWKEDPYFLYNPNMLRSKKVNEEEIIRTRPQYYAVKRLRELEGLSFSPPYEILPMELRKGSIASRYKQEHDDERTMPVGDGSLTASMMNEPDSYMSGFSNDPKQIQQQMLVFQEFQHSRASAV